MIQSALFFILGVLCAVLIAILLAPSLWRRASVLSQRRVEAEIPLTLTEIYADRDGLRATHAIAISKLTMKLKAMQENCAQSKIELGENHQALKIIPKLHLELEQLRQTTQQQDASLLTSADNEKTIRTEIDRLVRETERLERHQDALGSLADTLRIELTASETEKSQLYSQINDMRRSRKEANMRQSDLSTQLTAAQITLEGERSRRSELEKKLERLMHTLSDAQEKLERQDKLLSNTAKTTKSAQYTKGDKEIREQISALAAEMVVMTAEREGAQSPIPALLSKSDDSEKASADLTGSAGRISPSRKNKPAGLAKHIRDLS